MELLSHRVGIDHVIRGGERIGILYLETGSNARPSRIFYDRANSSLATIELGVIDWKEIFKDACWFHWTGITLLCLKMRLKYVWKLYRLLMK